MITNTTNSTTNNYTILSILKNIENNYVINNDTQVGYSLFESDHVFYGVVLVIFSVVVLLGLFLFVCMIYKPSYGSEEKLSSSSHILHQCDLADKLEHPALAKINRSGRSRAMVSAHIDDKPNGGGSGSGSISILDTKLPPLVPQSTNNIRPGEIQQLRNALEEAEQHQEVIELGGTNRRLQDELRSLDITSLTNSFKENNY